MTKTAISIGILGAGGYGRSARGNLRHSGEFDIAVCMDTNEEAARTAAVEESSVAATTLEELLNFPGLEAVSINTPIPLHAEHSLRCLEAGKHVLITKPVARSVGEARDVADAAARNHLAYMVGHHARHEPSILKMKQEMEAGTLGRICNILVTCCSSSGLVQQPGDWRAEPGQNPGGPLLHCGIHLLDVLRSLFGEVSTVSAVMQEEITSYEAIDNTLTLLEFEDGVQAAVVCNYTTAYMHTLDIFGTMANLHHHQHITDLGQEELYLQVRKGGPHEPWEKIEIPGESAVNRHGSVLEKEFARQIRAQDYDYENLRESIAALRIVEAAVESHKSGKRIRIEA
jgi:predicted dehydrogenase